MRVLIDFEQKTIQILREISVGKLLELNKSIGEFDTYTIILNEELVFPSNPNLPSPYEHSIPNQPYWTDYTIINKKLKKWKLI